MSEKHTYFDAMKTKSITIAFEGQGHQVDVNTLINTLVHYSAIINEINKEVSGGSRCVKVDVKAIREGSFVIDICIADKVFDIFSNGTLVYLYDLITTIGGVIKIYKHFKGKRVTEEEVRVSNVTINGNHNTINIYNGRSVREAISKSIETVQNDSNIEGLTISGDNMQQIEFKRQEFPELIYTDFDTEEECPSERDRIVDANLVIVGLHFEKGKKWDFIYDGYKISMFVKDDALMKQIDGGARFGKGDSIRVKLKIMQRFNVNLNAYENRGYKIIEFHEHISKQNPKQLDIEM